MKEQLVTFETAKLAKEKGFGVYQEECWYKKEESQASYHITEEFVDITYRPTQSLLQKWLREEHSIEVFTTPTHISYINNKEYKVEVEYLHGNRINCFKHDTFKTYEEALEKGLQEALKLII